MRDSISECFHPALVIISLLLIPQSLAVWWIEQTTSGNNNGSPPNVIIDWGEYLLAISLITRVDSSILIAVGFKFLFSISIKQCLQRELQRLVTRDFYILAHSNKHTSQNSFNNG
jgi:hypothetical protein